MEKILSISVAAYNAEKDLERCLDSMLNTNVAERLEVIIVNDGSKDRTIEIANEYAYKYPDIVKIIDKENGGHGSTINASLKIAKGKYYKIVDSDDWLDKEGIQRLITELESTDADLVLNSYHEVYANNISKKSLVKPFAEHSVIGEKRNIEKCDDIVIYMHSTTYKTSIIKQMGAIIDENCFYVDMEYTLFPLRYALTYICYDFPVYQYLLGTATQSMNLLNLIDRRDQHKRVTENIIEFYEDVKKLVGKGQKDIILRRVRLAMLNQYKIYFNMKEKNAKVEIVSFDKRVKAVSRDVYKGPEGRFMKIIVINRMTNYIIFRPTVAILKILHLELNI